jgi:hypothetical protein
LGRQLRRAATRAQGEGMDLAEHRRRLEERRSKLLGRAAGIHEQLLRIDSAPAPLGAERSA